MPYFSSIEIQCNVGTNSLGYNGMLLQKIMQSTHKLGTKFQIIQWDLDLRKPDLSKNLNLRKIVGITEILVNKLFFKIFKTNIFIFSNQKMKIYTDIIRSI